MAATREARDVAAEQRDVGAVDLAAVGDRRIGDLDGAAGAGADVGSYPTSRCRRRSIVATSVAPLDTVSTPLVLPALPDA